ncbi:hypothetical protein POM88_008164 [Heracleum sosnowskyi]|uniref:Uncharacterized protein n=1 Tax=Heracleum sosnowskyi TaxID=360622 RepID=A0AAD8J6X1_9APIA|nr:hypothetical protein POM88_008164 [Heracleum sosnowskyi]
MPPSNIQIPLKVLIHKEEKKVIFAEANGDFVDVLFSFLTMPLGTIVRLLSKHSEQPTIGSFNNLYKSIANLEAEYFTSDACKDMLLNTRNSAERECQKLKINIDDIKPVDYFTCEDMNCTEGNSHSYLSTYNNVLCKNCYKYLNRKAHFFPTTAGGEQGVFVPPNASFVITDDLQVIPNIPSAMFALFKGSGITDFGVLEEKTFNIRSTEILDLLRYSILSRTPLTRMFLGGDEIIKNKSVQPVTRKMSTEAIISFFCFILRKCFISLKKMTVKVLVQKSSSKILLAHCSEDFIDFLFNLLTLPLGRVISLLKSEHSPALCAGHIHQSVSNLNAFALLRESLMSTSVLTNGLKHLIRNKPDTEKLLKKPSDIEKLMEESTGYGSCQAVPKGTRASFLIPQNWCHGDEDWFNVEVSY